MKTAHAPNPNRRLAPSISKLAVVRPHVAAGVSPAVEPWRLARRNPRAKSECALNLVAGSGRQDAALYGRRDASRYGQLADLPCLLVCVFLTLPVSGAVLAAENQPPSGFVALFNGKDFSSWKVPDGDNGHWKVAGGVIDYDAESEAKGDKTLWTEREYGDFVLHVDWRIKETPYVNPNVPYILPDGTHARDVKGKEMKLSLPDSDSGIYIRGASKYQLNIWCWPIGSGEMYGIRTDSKMPADVRAAVTPRTQADKPVGEWNHFEITVRGDTVTVMLNGKTVIPGAKIPDLPLRGRLALQHHGGKQGDKWNSPPALVQFKNIFIKELK